jgi:predicted  nucleic acid-binding Zn-ribbon protein
VADIKVKHDPSTGQAQIQLTDVSFSEARLRLRDTGADKYLTRRGWTKTASFLPGEAVLAEGAATLTIDADLARKIPVGAALSLEQPTSGYRQAFVWPDPDAAPVALEPEPSQAAPEPAAPDTEIELDFPPTLDLASFEPPIMDDHVRPDPERPAAPSEDAVAAANDNGRRRNWMPAVVAAAICLVLGAGIGTLATGSDDSAAVKEARQAASIQIEKQKWEFGRQLAAVRAEVADKDNETGTATDERIASLNEDASQIRKERDEALAAAAARSAEIETLRSRLADADSQLKAARSGIEDTAKAAIGVLETKVATLEGQLAKARTELDARERQIAETQTRLTEADRQVAAVKDAAQKESDALNADLAEKTDSLSAEIEKLQQRLAESESAARAAAEKLASATAARDLAERKADSQATQANAQLTVQVQTLTARVEDAERQLAEREKAMRDAQAQLSVANIQIDALKAVAEKSTGAGFEKDALDKKIASQAAELDRLTQAIADRDGALAAASEKLKTAETALAAQATFDAANGTPSNAQATAPSEELRRLREERDLYQSELKTLTDNFTTLQTQKTNLEKTVASLQAEMKGGTLTTSQIPAKAVWGATAIDQTGTIYALQNQTAEKSAGDNVTAMCRGKSKFRCELLATYSNACFSVARFEGEGPASDNFAYFVHKDWKTSADTAVERCQSLGAACTVRFTACSPDALSKPVSN